MSIINFSKANCRNCYKCVRSCPVKAIKVKDEQAQIVEELCIACGQCLRVCPKNAKEIKSEIDVVKEYINGGVKIAVSLAPSFASAFDMDDETQIVTALKKLGFSYVEETSIAATVVSNEYKKFYSKDDDGVYITTSCPAANNLIEKYHPGLIKNMIPVNSPMVCHGKMLKQKYGDNIKVVFMGPCLAKKMEALDHDSIDAVLTFEELEKWFEAEGINLKKLEASSFDSIGYIAARQYPLIGGIIESIDAPKAKDIYKVDGIENCLDFLSDIEKNPIKNAFIEINLCGNSCINGPAMTSKEVNCYVRKNRLEKYINECQKFNNNSKQKQYDVSKLDLKNNFKDKSRRLRIPNTDEIKKILSSIGKNTIADELNCGACGYNTCKQKAIAVYNGMAEPYMCLPYMRHRAETVSNLIFDVTPNIIFIINNDLEIISFNPAAENFFNITREFAQGKPVSMIIEDQDFALSMKNQENIISKRVLVKEYNAIVLETAIYLKEHESLLIILNDITNEEKKEEKLQKLKINTLDMAQEVINKQMTVAQEIASLLGETTAETKVILTKLKKIVQGEEEGLK